MLYPLSYGRPCLEVSIASRPTTGRRQQRCGHAWSVLRGARFGHRSSHADGSLGRRGPCTGRQREAEGRVARYAGTPSADRADCAISRSDSVAPRERECNGGLTDAGWAAGASVGVPVCGTASSGVRDRLPPLLPRCRPSERHGGVKRPQQHGQ